MKYIGIALTMLLAVGCASEDPGALPPTDKKPQNIEETLSKVPPEQRESVRKTIEENNAKYGSDYSKAMQNQGKK